MSTLYNIWTISRFEARTLYRSWFFRIFAFIGIFFILVFNLAIWLGDGSRWSLTGLASVIPYNNLIFANVAQAIIIAFLATEFLKRDKKLDTTEVIYIRSMSNGEYVLGKSLGTLFVFFILNFIVLLITGLVNMAMDWVEVDMVSYLIFPFLISLPTLIFILGLSYFVMILLKNQAVTFVILLGYIAGVLFYLQDMYNFSFNFLALGFPMIKSDLSGFTNFIDVIQQRGIFLLFGLSLIFLTVLLLSRLEQSKKMAGFSLIMAVITGLGGSTLLYQRIIHENSDLAEREYYRSVEAEYIVLPNATIEKHKIDITHRGESIQSSSTVGLINKNSAAIDSFFLVLNPGLNVTRLELDGDEANYQRKGQILTISSSLKSGQKASLEIDYEGRINDNAMYLDIDEETRGINYMVASYAVGKAYSFVKPNYLLLTQEANWYPATRIPFNKEAGIMTPAQFVEFDLTVRVNNGLYPVSQGAMTEEEGGVYHFKHEDRLTQISLIAGDYEVRSIQVDSIEYRLVVDKDHYYFDQYFPNLPDTLSHLIKDLKNEFEAEININYPFKRYSIVEVPASFVSFPRLHTTAREVMQPEMSLLPEKGLVLINADFGFRLERIGDSDRWSESTEVEIETMLFRGFITSAVTVAQGGWSVTNDEARVFSETFSMFPNYYSFTNFVDTDYWPFFNKSLESYLWQKVSPPRQNRWWSATSEAEDANLALQEKSFEEIVAKEERALIDQVIQSKGNFLFTSLQEKIGDDKFRSSLSDFISQNRFEVVDLGVIDEAFDLSDSISAYTFLSKTLTAKALPSYLISEPEVRKFIDGDRTRFQVRFDVSNVQQAEGLVEFSIRLGRGGRRGGGGFRAFRFDGGGAREEDNSIKKLVSFNENENKQVSIIVDEEPSMLTANTLISENLPNTINFQLNEPEEINGVPEEYIRDLVNEVSLSEKGEMIVDNEDDGFTFSKGQADTPLRAFIKGEQEAEDVEYAALNWRAPRKWTPTVSTWAYGDQIRSAHFIRSGDGSQTATWEADIQDGGIYDVYVYINTRINPFGRRDESNNDTYSYTVYSDDGEDNIEIRTSNAENGWNRLGSYYFSEGKGKVEISNESSARTVVADAVKWVLR